MDDAARAVSEFVVRYPVVVAVGLVMLLLLVFAFGYDFAVLTARAEVDRLPRVTKKVDRPGSSGEPPLKDAA